jgi:hypothetical protein
MFTTWLPEEDQERKTFVSPNGWALQKKLGIPQLHFSASVVN